MIRPLSIVAVLAAAGILTACNQVGVDKLDEHGTTALMRAARRGDSVEVVRLIEVGADVNAQVPRRDLREIAAFAMKEDLPKSDVDFTPLLYAARAGRANVARILIANGADVRYTTRAGETPLDFAVRRSKDVPTTRVIAARTPIDPELVRFAVKESKPELLQVLLARADSATRAAADAKPFAPLMIEATKRGNPAVVKQLVDAGFRVNTRDRNGWSALRWAREARTREAAQAAEVLALLETAGARDDGGEQALDLIDAVLKKDVVRVRAALKAGTNPNVRDNSSVPALVHAADLGQPDIVQALIDAGAQLDIRPHFGSTPLTAAIQHGSVESVKKLLAAGARSDQSDSKGYTPMTSAALWNRAEIIALLLADSAQVSPQALSSAVSHGDTVLVRLMLDHGADPTKGRSILSAVYGCKDRDNTLVIRMLLQRGVPAKLHPDYGMLHRAVVHCSVEAVQLLIQHGADVNLRDYRRATPLMLAANADRADMVSLLLATGADVNAKDEDGKNALRYARRPEVWRQLQQGGGRAVAARWR
jgi:ankyrin repeat protein